MDKPFLYWYHSSQGDGLIFAEDVCNKADRDLSVATVGNTTAQELVAFLDRMCVVRNNQAFVGTHAKLHEVVSATLGEVEAYEVIWAIAQRGGLDKITRGGDGD